MRKASAARGGKPASRNSLELKYHITIAILPVPRRIRGAMTGHDEGSRKGGGFGPELRTFVLIFLENDGWA